MTSKPVAGITDQVIRDITGCTPDQLKDWSSPEVGLIEQARRDYQAGVQGVRWYRPLETIDRVRIIMEQIEDTHSREAAADELYLRGYSPVQASALHRVLIRWATALDNRITGGRVVDDPATEQKNIRRAMRNAVSRFLPSGLVLPVLYDYYALAGVPVPGYPSPLPSTRAMLHIINEATDEQRQQATAMANQILARHRNELNGVGLRLAGRVLNLPNQIWPEHRCKRDHSFIEGVRPLVTVQCLLHLQRPAEDEESLKLQALERDLYLRPVMRLAPHFQQFIEKLSS